MNTPTSERLAYNAEEVANLLSVGRSKVYELIKSGNLPSVKIGGSRRVLKTTLDAYLRELEAA